MSFYPPHPNYNHIIPLPQQYARPPTLDYLLQSMPRGVGLAWSVSQHPITADPRMVLPYGETWRNKPATTPCVTSLTVYSAPTGDRPIVIRRDPFITIEDVLLEVYCAIRRAARDRFQPTYQPLLIHAYHPQPVAAHPPPSEAQIDNWVLHHLGGRSTWMGLSSYQGPETWFLDVR